MATVADRKIAAIVGTIVADAAAQPIHWVYDAAKLDSLLEGTDDVEFFKTRANPFYHIDTGLNSCYGDQAFVLLESLVACSGLDKVDLADRIYKEFGPGSSYANPIIDNCVDKSAIKEVIPISTPWKHVSVKHFLKKYEEKQQTTGSDDDQQIDGVTRLAPLVALYAGRPEMLTRVEEACRVMQNDDFTVTCVLAAARLLEHYILHGPDADALEKVIAELSDPNRSHPQELDRGMATKLKEVVELKGRPHREVVTENFRKD